MIRLGLNEEQNDKNKSKRGFWQQQFQKESTKSQRKFDWIFGVILPVICFVFDPIVFKGDAWGAAFLGSYKPFAYILSFVSVMAIAAWLIWDEKLKWLNGILSGFFAVGGIISLAVGILLFPFSLLGLIMLIGALGFTPLFTSIVFLRNASRSYQAAKPFLQKKLLINAFVLSAILSFAFPAILNLKIKETLDEIEKGDVQTIHAKAQNLKYVAPLVNFDLIALFYHRSAKDERKTEKMKAIAEVYKEITGEDIETKAWVLMD